MRRSQLDCARPLELRLLTGLAAGADQCAALAAVRARWEVHAIIPYSTDLYRAGLGESLVKGDPMAQAAAAKRAEDIFDAFTRPLAGNSPAGASPAPPAERVCTLADWHEDGAMADDVREYWRSRRYRTLGQVLVRQADLLIAVWDGGPGGAPAAPPTWFRQPLPRACR